MGRIVTGRVTQTVETRVSATELAGNVTEDVSLDGGIPNVTQVRSIVIDCLIECLVIYVVFPLNISISVLWECNVYFYRHFISRWIHLNFTYK